MSEQELVERIAQRVAELVLEETEGIAPHRIYTPAQAARLLAIDTDSDRGARQALDRLGVRPVRRSAGGKLKGYAGIDLIQHIERERKKAS